MQTDFNPSHYANGTPSVYYADVEGQLAAQSAGSCVHAVYLILKHLVS